MRTSIHFSIIVDVWVKSIMVMYSCEIAYTQIHSRSTPYVHKNADADVCDEKFDSLH